MRSVALRRGLMATVLLSTVVTTGCYGSFPLTRKLYNYNKSFSSDKWMRELFFLATGVLLPVYGVASLIDVLILNSQEFWTGKTSVAARPESSTKVVTRGNVSITQTMSTVAGARSMVLEERVDGVLRSRTTMHQAAGASRVDVETVFADGRVERKSLTATEAGALTISEANGTPRTLSAVELAQLAARVQHLGASGVAAQ